MASMLRGIRTAHNLPSAQSTTLLIAPIPQQEVTGYGHHSLRTIPADQPIFVGKELASISIQSGAGSEHHRGLRALASHSAPSLFDRPGSRELGHSRDRQVRRSSEHSIDSALRSPQRTRSGGETRAGDGVDSSMASQNDF